MHKCECDFSFGAFLLLVYCDFTDCWNEDGHRSESVSAGSVAFPALPQLQPSFPQLLLCGWLRRRFTHP